MSGLVVHRRPALAILALAATLSWSLAGCSSADDGGSGSRSTSGLGEFSFSTADGKLSVSGTASTCENPDKATLNVTFEGDGATVTVAVKGGKGSIVVTGDDGFQGTISNVQVADTGDVDASGTGATADDTETDTRFTLTGRCP
ncbi:hypothetical protein [Cellulomonas sp. P5_E12]